MDDALRQQVGGSHYSDLQIQPVEFIAANGWDFFAGNMLAYLARWREKGGVQDLEKTVHHGQLRIRLQAEQYHMPRDRRPITMDEFISTNNIDRDTAKCLDALDQWVISSGNSHNIKSNFFTAMELLIGANDAA